MVFFATLIYRFEFRIVSLKNITRFVNKYGKLFIYIENMGGKLLQCFRSTNLTFTMENTSNK